MNAVIFHLIKSGDSFSSIAQERLGDQRAFIHLQSLNTNVKFLPGNTVRLLDKCTCGQDLSTARPGQVCSRCHTIWIAE